MFTHELIHAIETAAAGLAIFLVVRLWLLLRRREHDLAQATATSARAERLTALATLAAGAAHELSTPLATLATLSRRIEGDDGDVIRAEIERCRTILSRMSAHSDVSLQREAIDAVAFIDAVRTTLGNNADRVTFHIEPGTTTVHLPLAVTLEAVRGVVDNALSAARARVDVMVGSDEAGAQIVVSDDGAGIPADARAHVGEPFMTTKPTGTGLGLFLARVVCERTGGELVIDTNDKGTTVLLDIPARQPGA